MKKIIKKFDVELKKVDGDDNSFEAVFSTQGEDRHGDVIIQEGFDLKSYKKNPVILNSHNHDDATEVIGKVDKRTLKIEKKKLSGKIKFAVDENPKAKIIYDLYSKGYLNAFSVGFIPKKFDEKDMSIIQEAELIEISAVSVPANAAALAKQKGINIDKLYDKSRDKNNDGDKKSKKTTKKDNDDSKTKRKEDKTDKNKQAKRVSKSTKEKETKEEGFKKEIKKLNERLEKLEGKREVKKEEVKKEEVKESELSREEKIKKAIKEYNDDKLNKLQKINKAVAIVSDYYKGRKSDSKSDNNYIINNAVRKLLKLKD